MWDEDNLIYNESHKTATMKIDEPPTPYNKDYDSAEDEEDEPATSATTTTTNSLHEKENEDVKQRKKPIEINTEAAARAHFDQVSTALEECKSNLARRPRFSSDEDTEDDDEKGMYTLYTQMLLPPCVGCCSPPARMRAGFLSHPFIAKGPASAEFVKKRSQHYNEWKKLQEFRKTCAAPPPRASGATPTSSRRDSAT